MLQQPTPVQKTKSKQPSPNQNDSDPNQYNGNQNQCKHDQADATANKLNTKTTINSKPVQKQADLVFISFNETVQLSGTVSLVLPSPKHISKQCYLKSQKVLRCENRKVEFGKCVDSTKVLVIVLRLVYSYWSPLRPTACSRFPTVRQTLSHSGNMVVRLFMLLGQ